MKEIKANITDTSFINNEGKLMFKTYENNKMIDVEATHLSLMCGYVHFMGRLPK